MEGALAELVARLSTDELARRLDLALVKPWAARSEVERAVELLERLRLRCLITTPPAVREVASMTSACVGAVVGFPFGYSTIESKIKELEDVIGYGAREADIVVNYHAYLLGRRDYFSNEVKALVTICREVGLTCKLILEVAAVPPEALDGLLKSVLEHQPDFIKTGTGYGPRPALPDDVVAVKRVLAELGLQGRVRIKVAGGIRTALQALTFIALGADVIGTSAAEDVLRGFEELKRRYL